MRSVHYFIRNPAVLGEVIYPKELGSVESYQGYGSFFMLGDDDNDVDDEYQFPAVLEGAVIAVSLRRRVNSSTYEASIAGLGSFEFRATKIGIGARYIGNSLNEDGRVVVRQLAPQSRNKLEQAALANDFYFIGFTPGIEFERLAD